MAVLVLAAVFLKFNSFFVDFGRIDSVGEAEIATSLWYENVATDINTNGVRLYLGDEEERELESNIYMDENLNLMISVDAVAELLDCSAHVYGNETALLLKYEDNLSTSVNASTGILNGESYELGSGLTLKDDTYYVPIAKVAEALGYTYYWNAGESRIELVNEKEGAPIVPAAFDLRDYARTSNVKNQGQFGTCWAFAALASLESTILPENNQTFSPDHMTIRSNFSIQQETGGAYTMAMAYLAGWQGPVLEKDDPYGDGASPEGLLPILHVQEMQLLPDKDYAALKRAVFLYGGVQSSLYNDLTNAFSVSSYYNKETSSYCYQGENIVNHQVVIVGWDDNYSKDNFNGNVEGDGAFICQNSWGSHFGDGGYFYVSYYDSYIGTNAVAFTRIESTDNFDHIYQADLCGWVGQIGYGDEVVYGANLFRAERDEEVAAVGFYATGTGTDYKVYVLPDFESTEDLQEAELLASGTTANAGYYSIDLEHAVSVNKGETFAVVVCLEVPGATYPMAVEYRANELTRSVILRDGTGYISRDGKKWESVEENYKCNLCIKAYTNEK